MLDPVGSTSWHNRHHATFKRLDELLAGSTPRPVVVIVGPGAVTRAAAGLLNNAGKQASDIRKLIGDAARYGDQLLRRIPAMPLRSLEPAELASALSMPHRLVIVDRSQRVLAAAARSSPQAQCYCVDITFQALPVTADVVIAFNVICRLENPAAGMARVAEAVHTGGLLLIDDRSAAAHLEAFPRFVPVAPKTYRLGPGDRETERS